MNGINYFNNLFMNIIISADRKLFEFINDHLHNPFLNWLMPLVRNSIIWLPLYMFMLVFILLNFKKDKYWWIFFAIGTAVLADFISSDLIKKNFFRLRPIHDPYFANKINYLLSYKPGSSSFTSSHATNHFAMAAFFFFTLKQYLGKTAWVFYFWAAIICFAQVYIGVHYPLDVVCGGIIGFVFGYLSARSFNRRYLLM